MGKQRRIFVCSDCGAEFGKWLGKCSQCGQFGTVAESIQHQSVGLKASGISSAPSRPALPVREINDSGPIERMSTGLDEFDRILGGGLVPGQVLLLFGEPGAGKSTLLLTTANNVAEATGQPVLYMSGEESMQQLAVRARRIEATSENLFVADGNDLAEVIGQIESLGEALSLVIVDSVQSIASAEVDGRAGGVVQVMEVSNTLTRLAKQRNTPICLVGQVTKESTVAGPRALEHVCDTSLSIEGDRQTPLRLLRTVKNRYGPADEIACFEQTDTGMVEVPDPSGLFRGVRSAPIPGTCITVTVEGRRPLLVEMQALVSPTNAPNPRRGVSGLDSSRVAMLMAVTERIAGVKLFDKDVYAATVGGMRSNDPGSDLAVCLAIASAATGLTLPLDLAAIGEVSLSGDIRRVAMLGQRTAEAMRLGYRRILVPAGTRESITHEATRACLREVETIQEAFQALQASE
jgi:DNA repair protein RadA/Sms